MGKGIRGNSKSIIKQSKYFAGQGVFNESEKSYLEALRLQEKLTGKELEYYAVKLNKLTYLYYEYGHYEKSEKLDIETRDIRERIWFNSEQKNDERKLV